MLLNGESLDSGSAEDEAKSKVEELEQLARVLRFGTRHCCIEDALSGNITGIS